MKKLVIITVSIFITGVLMNVTVLSKDQGEQCFNNSECSFGLTCKGGVCVKKKEFDFGSSGKSGNPCNNDADCINSGKCIEGRYGKKVCSGN